MKINSILHRSILKDLFPPFGINLLFFMFIFLITRILEIINLIVNYRVSAISFLLLLLYSLPFFLEFIIPMSVMMAVLLTFLRLSGDNEIVAMKSCGLSLHHALVPVLLFCLMGWALTTFMAVVALPWGNRSTYEMSVRLAKSNFEAIVKERTFIDSFEGVMLYVNKMDVHHKTLQDVFIEDQRTQGIHNTIIAPRAVGRIIDLPEQPVVHLKLNNGVINRVDLTSHTASSIEFETYEMNLPLKQLSASGIGKRKPLEEMALSELNSFISKTPKTDKQYYRALMKLHEKFSLPFACFALGFLAIPLGIQSKTQKRSLGAVIGIVLFLSYYILLSVGWSFGESGALPPLVGMWTPNAVLGGLGVYLYLRTSRDKPIAMDKLPAVFKIWLWWPRQRTSFKP